MNRNKLDTHDKILLVVLVIALVALIYSIISAIPVYAEIICSCYMWGGITPYCAHFNCPCGCLEPSNGYPPGCSYNLEGIYYRLDKLYDLMHVAVENIITLQFWQVGLLSFSAGVLVMLVVAVVWGRLS